MPNIVLPPAGVALGQDDMAGSLPVVIASDQSAVPVTLPVDGTSGANAKVEVLAFDYDSNAFSGLFMNEGYLLMQGNVSVSNFSGIVRTSEESDFIYSNNAELAPAFAPITAASNGNNTIIAAVSNKKIRVLSLSLSASAAVNVKFQSGASGTDITGLYYLAANGSVVLPYDPHGWLQTATAELLNLHLSSAVPVGGCLTYIEVT